MVAMRKVLADHPGAVVPCYLDDTHIFGIFHRVSKGVTSSHGIMRRHLEPWRNLLRPPALCSPPRHLSSR
jgi:hypothetical protein